MTENVTLTCSKCGSPDQLTYTYHKRNTVICESCRSKPTTSVYVRPKPTKSKVNWLEQAKIKNSAIAKKYNYAGNRI